MGSKHMKKMVNIISWENLNWNDSEMSLIRMVKIIKDR